MNTLIENRPTTKEISNWLVYQLTEKLNIQKDVINLDKPFADYGLDSIAAVNIAGEMEDWLGVEVEVTLLWDYPNIEALSNYLVEENFK